MKYSKKELIRLAMNSAIQNELSYIDCCIDEFGHIVDKKEVGKRQDLINQFKSYLKEHYGTSCSKLEQLIKSGKLVPIREFIETKKQDIIKEK